MVDLHPPPRFRVFEWDPAYFKVDGLWDYERWRRAPPMAPTLYCGPQTATREQITRWAMEKRSQDVIRELADMVEHGDAPALGQLKTDDFVHTAYYALASRVLEVRDALDEIEAGNGGQPDNPSGR